MEKINNKIKREVAYALSTYVFKRLWANRELQNLKFLGNVDELVDLDDYSTVIRLQEEVIEQIDAREREGNYIEHLVRIEDKSLNDTTSIKDNKQENAKVNQIMEEAINFVLQKYGKDKFIINYRDTMVCVLNYLKDKVSKRVILSRDNINDLKELIEYYVTRFDFDDTGYMSENEFLRTMLGKIVKSSKEKRMQDLALKYLKFFGSSNAGFDERISGALV